MFPVSCRILLGACGRRWRFLPSTLLLNEYRAVRAWVIHIWLAHIILNHLLASGINPAYSTSREREKAWPTSAAGHCDFLCTLHHDGSDILPLFTSTGLRHGGVPSASNTWELWRGLSELVLGDLVCKGVASPPKRKNQTRVFIIVLEHSFSWRYWSWGHPTLKVFFTTLLFCTSGFWGGGDGMNYASLCWSELPLRFAWPSSYWRHDHGATLTLEFFQFLYSFSDSVVWKV